MIYYEKPFITVSWNELDQWVEVEWRGFIAEPDFVAAQQAIVALTAQKRALSMLIDTRKTGPINHAMQQILWNDINPRLAATGLKYKAFINPERETARISVDDAGVAAQHAGVKTAQFGSKAAAIAWLRDQTAHE